MSEWLILTRSQGLRGRPGSYPIELRAVMPHHASMTAQIYNIAATSVNTILMNPFILIVLMVVALAIVTGLAGRVAILLEDLHHDRVRSRAA